MKKLFFITLGLLLFSISSCTKDEEETIALIKLQDSLGTSVQGVTVYGYKSSTWNLFGDDEFFSDKVISSDANGQCEFVLDNIVNLFAFDNQETLYFSAHYTLDSIEKQKYTSLSFTKGQEKTATIILD